MTDAGVTYELLCVGNVFSNKGLILQAFYWNEEGEAIPDDVREMNRERLFLFKRNTLRAGYAGTRWAVVRREGNKWDFTSAKYLGTYHDNEKLSIWQLQSDAVGLKKAQDKLAEKASRELNSLRPVKRFYDRLRTESERTAFLMAIVRYITL